jgi:peptide/nickel transport system permease protein
MLRYVISRLLHAIPVFLGVTVLVFAMVRALPGDPARVIAGEHASAQQIQQIRERFGLDEPVVVQYATFLGNLLRGDLGTSLRTQGPVSREIAARLPYTASLAGASVLLAVLIGVPLGVVAARYRHRALDYVATSLGLFGVSIPVFWSGLMLISIFAVQLRWLPSGGTGTAAHFVLPTLTLALFSVAIIMRMTRSSMLEVLDQDYIRTARAKGVAERLIIVVHGLRNAFVPILTVVGLQLGALLGGAVLTETIFAWPGIGRFLVDSIIARDYAAVQGTILVFSVLFVLINITVDVLYAFVDPRIRYD